MNDYLDHRYQRAIAKGRSKAHSQRMLRRSIALALWAYFAWYLGAMVSSATGLPPLIGPLGGLAMAAFALYDWRRPRHTSRDTRTAGFQPSR